MSSQLADPQHHSTIDYESDEEIDNSRYQIAFNDTMERYNLNNPLTYQKVEVLLLQWAKKSTDLSSALDDEVKRLKAVLEQKFHYHAVIECLESQSNVMLQAQVNMIISNFTYKHQDPETLLIIYYAGHGKPGHVHGELRLFGTTSPNSPRIANSNSDREKGFDEFVWNRAESLLKATSCNVLEIFDCCYAGTIGTRGEPNFFEFLAATEAMGTTARPGPKSFTSALIYALEELLRNRPGGRFTTTELLREIMHRAPHFPKDQTPVLSNREDDDVAGRIVLHPLKEGHRTGQVDREKVATTVEHEEKSEEPIQPVVEHLSKRVLTIHFDYPQRPSIEQITALAGPIMHNIQRNRLGVGIRFGSVQHTTTGRVIRRFARGSKRRQSVRQEKYSLSPSTIDRSSHSLDTPQIRPSSSSSTSPGSLSLKDFAGKPLPSPVTPNTEISNVYEAVESTEEREGPTHPSKKRKSKK